MSENAATRGSDQLTEILAYEHVGIRITDRERSLAFYRRLGFELEMEYPDSTSKAIELVNARGVRINLIWNAAPRMGAVNVLQDEPVKMPGLTHIAFSIADLDAAIAACSAAGVRITEGPKSLPRRSYIFIRDPDGNVIELNEYTVGAR